LLPLADCWHGLHYLLTGEVEGGELPNRRSQQLKYHIQTSGRSLHAQEIQEESLYYEHKKHDGSLPIIGVNAFAARATASPCDYDTSCLASLRLSPALMEAGKVCSLGSMSHALCDVVGEYRRNM
jgi:methylmalonyl-CoA mutase N-terminal domain/subunit